MNLETATPAQREAITTEERDVLLVAGPGSGKTATLVARIEALLRYGVNPLELVVLTFTNAAAGELQRRLPTVKKSATSEPEPVELGHVGTLHSFALRMLKEHGDAIGYGARVSVVSPESAVDLLESKAKTLGYKRPMKDLLAVKALGRPARGFRLDLAQTIVASYFDDLKEAGVVDYDVLLTELLELLAVPAVRAKLEIRFSHLFVDEVQDSARVDWAIYRALPIENKFHVGDSDQAIYSFRGGDVREMVLHAERPTTQTIKLEDNFRSRAEICDAANRLIGHNLARVPKLTRSDVGDGGAVRVLPATINEGAELGIVAKAIRKIEEINPELSIAVLSRTNAVAASFRKTLAAVGIAVAEQKLSELPPDWRVARAFVELLSDPDNDALAFFYLIALYEKKGAPPFDARAAAHAARKAATAAGKSLNAANLHLTRVSTPAIALQALNSQGISREAVAVATDKFRELPAGSTVLDFALSLGEVRERLGPDEGTGVRCLTVHAAKGREFDVVFLVGFEDEVFPGRSGKFGAPAEHLEEERRLAFVALTRARREVWITHSETRVQTFGRHSEIVKRTPSRFIAEITGGAS